MKVLFLLGEEFEDMEFFYPYYRMIEEGHTPTVAGKKRGKIEGKHGYSAEVDIAFRDVRPEDYGSLVIPGGKGPSHIRDDPAVESITSHFFKSGKLVAAICHGPQVLVTADRVRGRNLTGYKSVKEEIVNAGGNYLDREVVIDRNLVSSRHPGDLPYFTKALLEKLK